MAYAEEWRNIHLIRRELGDRVSVQWVKGHSTDPLNNEVDALVNGTARSQRGVDETDRLPGYVTAVKEERPGTDLSHSHAADDVGQRGSGGIRAQVAQLLAKAAEDPQLSSFLAKGLDMALSSPSTTDKFAFGTVSDARTLQEVLNKRSMTR